MLIDPKKMYKVGTLAKLRGIKRQAMYLILKGRGLKPVMIDKVQHYDITLLGDDILKKKRTDKPKENDKA